MRSNQGLTWVADVEIKQIQEHLCSDVCLFFAFWCFDIKELADPGGTALQRLISPIHSKGLMGQHPFVCKPTNPELKPLTNSFYPALSEISLSEPLSPCPNHPCTGTRQLEIVPRPEPFEIIQMSQFYCLFCFVCSSHGNHNKGSCPCFPPYSTSLPALVLSQVT